MRVEHLSPFAESCSAVLKALFGDQPERGALSVRPQIVTSHQLNLVSCISGDLEGHVMYGMGMSVADRVASKILGSPVVTLDASGNAALAELGSMINNVARELLAAQGVQCAITEPTIVRGRNVKMAGTDMPTLVIPLELKDFGNIEVNVSVQERKQRVA